MWRTACLATVRKGSALLELMNDDDDDDDDDAVNKGGMNGRENRSYRSW